MTGVGSPTAGVPGRHVAVGDDGMALNVEVAGAGPPLLLLHGFTGSAASWRPFLPALGGRRVVAVDLPGHGASGIPRDPRRYSAEQCAQHLLAVLDHLGIDRTAVLGYSMGGRVALHLAASAPRRVSALVLESASPGLASAEARRERRASDEALASMVERDGVAAFVAYWERLPLFATQTRLPEEARAALRRQRLDNSAAGLAAALRGLGTGSQIPLWDRLAALEIPTLLLAGEEDGTYAEIATRMAALLPRSQVALVPAAGHAVHLEQPRAFGDLIGAFLARHAPTTTKGRQAHD